MLLFYDLVSCPFPTGLSGTGQLLDLRYFTFLENYTSKQHHIGLPCVLSNTLAMTKLYYLGMLEYMHYLCAKAHSSID